MSNRKTHAGTTLALVLFAAPALAQDQAQGPAQWPAQELGRSFDCVLKPSAELKLSAPVAGLIASVAVDRGSVVRRGDVIAALDSRVEAASVAIAKRRSEATTKVNSAQAKVVFLERKSVRSRLLSKTQIVSESALEEAETNLAVAREDAQEAQFEIQMARLELERATAVLDQRTVRSPIDGVVTERKLAPGEYWAEREAAVTLAALNPLHVEAFLPVALHGRLRLGDQAIIKPEEPVGGAYDAVVEVIDRVYDAASGTFGLRLKLANPDLSIPAGVRCRIAFRGKS